MSLIFVSVYTLAVLALGRFVRTYCHDLGPIFRSTALVNIIVFNPAAEITVKCEDKEKKAHNMSLETPVIMFLRTLN